MTPCCGLRHIHDHEEAGRVLAHGAAHSEHLPGGEERGGGGEGVAGAQAGQLPVHAEVGVGPQPLVRHVDAGQVVICTRLASCGGSLERLPLTGSQGVAPGAVKPAWSLLSHCIGVLDTDSW